ncbi:MAG: MFS transporter [Acidobacteriota bacterium]|nr:MFS transporter [Acidobacteriota bacterium]MDW3228502.1 MFS transporter [Acidobacteriota bacterium]MDY0231709.1 MFS transporter [Candidatus Saccharicenans sp.]
MNVRLRLSVMMFLQYAIWGAWAPVLSAYLQNNLGFSGSQLGIIFSLLPLATIISPFLGGQLADRYFPSEKVIAVLQLVGGVLLLLIAGVTSFNTMMWLMLLYSLVYAPTLALTNSIAFINLKDSEKEFGGIRVWGTIGWIAAGWALAAWRVLAKSPEGIAMRGDTLILAGIFSLIMGIYSFSLPHTPPQKEAARPWAFLEALKMLKDKNFLIFAIISFVVATELQFYYVLTSPFLTQSVGVKQESVSFVMTIAQFAEIFVMAFMLSWALRKFGMRMTLTLGILAWPIRYIIFVIGKPSWLVIASLALHGFCYVFFFTAAYIYVDNIAPKDIRNSAQSLIATIILGLGNFAGSLFCGWIQDIFTKDNVVNWTGTFMVPTVLTFLCLIIFMVFFRESQKKAATQASLT